MNFDFIYRGETRDIDDEVRASNLAVEESASFDDGHAGDLQLRVQRAGNLDVSTG